ncbi:MAG: RNA polymerase sigma factor SigZ [Phycisphaeraceae bacterium]|nr:RNA polymerase sigma factor SigZ [Phycisphaeraceae bacterium]
MNRHEPSTEQIWELLSDRLRGFLTRRVSDPQLAEDLLQETFLRIHQKVGDLDDQGRISAWVFRIANNLVIDHYRSNKRADEKGLEHAAAPIEDRDNLNHFVAGWLPDFIAALPETYREAARLYELDRLPQQEIADRLGLSLSGAKSRIQRGRARLRSMLQECCSFEQDRRGNIIGYQSKSSTGCDSCNDGRGC